MNFWKNVEKDIKKEEKNILKIDQSFEFWKNTLFGKVLNIFKWEKLPFPQKEIEIRLMSMGFCGVVNDAKVGIMAATGGMSGTTQYWDEFTNFTYAAPTAEGGSPIIYNTFNSFLDLRNFGECVIINNNAMRQSLIPLIDRTASLLAHCEISLKVALVNLRESSTFCATDENVAANIKAYHEKMYKGELDVVTDTSLIEAVKQIGVGEARGLGVQECLDARKEILRTFLSEIGVRSTQEKRERQISDEINADAQLLLFNISEMLENRKKACDEINELFGLSVSVDLAPEFSIIQNYDKTEVVNDENN